MKVRISLLILLLISSFGVVCAVTGVFEPTELKIASLINPNSSKNAVFGFFTWLGSTKPTIGILAILLLLPTRKRIGLPATVTVISTLICNEIIKAIIKRQRPLERLLEIDGYSFPSGHAMTAAALYMTVMFALFRICKYRWQKVLSVCISGIIPFMIGISRIYFNVHFASDVITGWCLGTAIAVIFDVVFDNIRKKQKAKKSDESNRS